VASADDAGAIRMSSVGELCGATRGGLGRDGKGVDRMATRVRGRMEDVMWGLRCCEAEARVCAFVLPVLMSQVDIILIAATLPTVTALLCTNHVACYS